MSHENRHLNRPNPRVGDQRQMRISHRRLVARRQVTLMRMKHLSARFLHRGQNHPTTWALGETEIVKLVRATGSIILHGNWREASKANFKILEDLPCQIRGIARILHALATPLNGITSLFESLY